MSTFVFLFLLSLIKNDSERTEYLKTILIVLGVVWFSQLINNLTRRVRDDYVYKSLFEHILNQSSISDKNINDR